VEYQKGDIQVLGHHGALTVDEDIPGVYSFTVLNPGSFREDVDIYIEVDGERIVPSLLAQAPPQLDVVLSEGGRVHAVYEHAPLSLYLLDPVGNRIEKGASADWRIASLSSVPFEELGIGSITVSFESKDLSREAVVPLAPLTDAVLMDRTIMDNGRDTRVEGRIVSTGGDSSELTLTVEHSGKPSPYNVFLTPMNGTGVWSDPEVGATLDISPQWTVSSTITVQRDAGTGRIEAPFTIRAFLPGGSEPGEMVLEMRLSGSNDTVRLSISDMFPSD
jgi:hypothetical protein